MTACQRSRELAKGSHGLDRGYEQKQSEKAESMRCAEAVAQLRMAIAALSIAEQTSNEIYTKIRI